MKAPAIYRPVHLLAFVSLAGSSLAFSLMFYHGLSNDLLTATAFIVCALGLELAKLASIVAPRSSGTVHRIVRTILTLILILGSVLATVVSIHQGIAPPVALIHQETESKEIRQEVIAGLQADIASVQRTLDQLPMEWRNTRAETLDHLVSLRSQLQEKLTRTYTQSVQSKIHHPGNSQNIPQLLTDASRISGYETPAVILLFALLIASISEAALFWVGRTLPAVLKAGSSESMRHLQGKLIAYVRTSFPEQSDRPLRGVRSTASNLRISMRQARELHAQLKRRGFIVTRGRSSYPAANKTDVLRHLSASNHS